MARDVQCPVCETFTVSRHEEPQAKDAEDGAKGEKDAEFESYYLSDKEENDADCPEPEVTEHVSHGIENDR